MGTQAQVKNQLEHIFQVFRASVGAIRPHSILTGQSGSGKTFLVQELAKAHSIPFIEINGAQLTNEGISGNSLSKALVPLGSYGDSINIVFIDEIDKLFLAGEDSIGSRDTTIRVQNELLKILESDSTDVIGDYGKYRQVNVGNTLFFFAGAFNNEEGITLSRLRQFGIRNEFLGRVGLVFHVDKPTLEELGEALKCSKVFDHYSRVFPSIPRENVYSYVMGIVAKYHDQNQLGMRILTTLLHQSYLYGGAIPQDVIESTCLIQPPPKIDLSAQTKQTEGLDLTWSVS